MAAWPWARCRRLPWEAAWLTDVWEGWWSYTGDVKIHKWMKQWGESASFIWGWIILFSRIYCTPLRKSIGPMPQAGI
jgi:hypothetical protein